MWWVLTLVMVVGTHLGDGGGYVVGTHLGHGGGYVMGTYLGHGGGYDLDVPGDVEFERLELLNDLPVLVVHLTVTLLSVMEQR